MGHPIIACENAWLRRPSADAAMDARQPDSTHALGRAITEETDCLQSGLVHQGQQRVPAVANYEPFADLIQVVCVGGPLYRCGKATRN